MGLAENFIGILKLSGGCNDMISWCGDAHQIVAEFECEFALAQVLFMLPAGDIGKGGKPWEPLSDFINRVAIFFERLITGSAADQFGIVDFVSPTDLERKLLSAQKRFWQVDSHHRIDGERIERFA